MPLVADQLPPEGNEVRITGTFSGEKRGYYINPLVPVWWESIDGDDALIVGMVLAWEKILPKPNDGE